MQSKHFTKHVIKYSNDVLLLDIYLIITLIFSRTINKFLIEFVYKYIFYLLKYCLDKYYLYSATYLDLYLIVNILMKIF